MSVLITDARPETTSARALKENVNISGACVSLEDELREGEKTQTLPPSRADKSTGSLAIKIDVCIRETHVDV